MQTRFTGVFATPSEMDRLRHIASKEALRRSLQSDKLTIIDVPPQQTAMDACNELALSHGLAPLPDDICYGVTQDGQFVAPADVWPAGLITGQPGEGS